MYKKEEIIQIADIFYGLYSIERGIESPRLKNYIKNYFHYFIPNSPTLGEQYSQQFKTDLHAFQTAGATLWLALRIPRKSFYNGTLKLKL